MKWNEALGESAFAVKSIAAYEGLNEREQIAVKALAAFLLPVFIIFGVILPASQYFNESKEYYMSVLEDVEWIQANRAAVPTSANTSEREPGQSLFGIANSTSKGFQVTFKRYEPVGENALSLWLEGVNFNNLVRWLERLDKRYGVKVKEIAVERQSIEGSVNVRLVLQG